MKTENQIFCNRCGKLIAAGSGPVKEDYVKVTKTWGYFSGKDGQRDEFCLCEACYDGITAAFVRPVSREELTELV